MKERKIGGNGYLYEASTVIVSSASDRRRHNVALRSARAGALTSLGSVILGKEKDAQRTREEMGRKDKGLVKSLFYRVEFEFGFQYLDSDSVRFAVFAFGFEID